LLKARFRVRALTMPAEGYCDRCQKRTDKLLRCGRCHQQVYCSQKCQTEAWPRHKGICRRPAKPRPPSPAPAPQAANSAHGSNVSLTQAAASNDAQMQTGEEPQDSDIDLRRRLLAATQAANARMVDTMRAGGGDPGKYSAPLQEVVTEYYREVLDRVRAAKTVKPKGGLAKIAAVDDPVSSTSTIGCNDNDEFEEHAARQLGRELMGEVIRACLQRGASKDLVVQQLDLGNNYFQAGVIAKQSPMVYKLPTDTVEGFEEAAARVCHGGFCCVDGLFDNETALALSTDFTKRHWEPRDSGGLFPSSGGGYGCWLPFPPRPGYTPELDDVLRVLFGLPYELVRAGYPQKLSVPTMVYLACLPPGALEPLHLDCDKGSSEKAEVSLVLFCSPQWRESDGGALRAHLTAAGHLCNPADGAASTTAAPLAEKGTTMGDAAEPSGKAGAADVGGVVVSPGIGEEGSTTVTESETDRIVPRPAPSEVTEKARQAQSFFPEAGRCLIFRSQACWHEVLPSDRMRFFLTLWATRAD